MSLSREPIWRGWTETALGCVAGSVPAAPPPRPRGFGNMLNRPAGIARPWHSGPLGTAFDVTAFLDRSRISKSWQPGVLRKRCAKSARVEPCNCFKGMFMAMWKLRVAAEVRFPSPQPQSHTWNEKRRRSLGETLAKISCGGRIQAELVVLLHQKCSYMIGGCLQLVKRAPVPFCDPQEASPAARLVTQNPGS